MSFKVSDLDLRRKVEVFNGFMICCRIDSEGYDKYYCINTTTGSKHKKGYDEMFSLPEIKAWIYNFFISPLTLKECRDSDKLYQLMLSQRTDLKESYLLRSRILKTQIDTRAKELVWVFNNRYMGIPDKTNQHSKEVI